MQGQRSKTGSFKLDFIRTRLEFRRADSLSGKGGTHALFRSLIIMSCPRHLDRRGQRGEGAVSQCRHERGAVVKRRKAAPEGDPPPVGLPARFLDFVQDCDIQEMLGRLVASAQPGSLLDHGPYTGDLAMVLFDCRETLGREDRYELPGVLQPGGGPGKLVVAPRPQVEALVRKHLGEFEGWPECPLPLVVFSAGGIAICAWVRIWN
jgi:hypothetical protein